jgi:aspartate aminotransferase
MISKSVRAAIENSGWIRELFETGADLTRRFGPEKVFDLSIGNPTFEPPAAVKKVLLELLQSDLKGLHRYTPNGGLPETRQFLAERLNKETGYSFLASDILISTGASGGLNVMFKTLCDPGDEVVVFVPYFAEYLQYVSNVGAIPRLVDTDESFRIDFEKLDLAINEKTKVVLINSPNNPTGVIYSADELKALGDLLRLKSKKFNRTIYLVADEPYKFITFDGHVTPSIFPAYEEALTVTSFSKDLAIPGERIGYVAVSPHSKERKLINDGLVSAHRTLGFINAPAMWQKVIPLAGDAKLDVGVYQKNRDILFQHLISLGFECHKPEGAFYLFPKSPTANDREFVKKALSHNMVLIPGSGFGRPGHFRICFCYHTDLIQRSLPVFEKLRP